MARSKEVRSAPKTPDRPTKRRYGKGPASPPAAPAQPPREPAVPPMDEPEGPQQGLDLTWDNFPEIKKHFGLNDTETIRVLTSLIGPKPDRKRSSAADSKPVHVKKEPVNKEPVNKEPVNEEPVNEEPVTKPCIPPVPAPAEPEVPAKRRRLRQMEVEESDNQLGDPALYPHLHPECYEAETNETEMMPEEGEEEDAENDGEVNPDEIGVPANTGNNDDQDSPQGGAAAETAATETVELSTPEPAEPVRVPVPKPDDPAELAKKQLEDNLKKRPTPGRQGRQIVEAKRIDSGEPQVKPARSHSIFQHAALDSVFLPQRLFLLK